MLPNLPEQSIVPPCPGVAGPSTSLIPQAPVNAPLPDTETVKNNAYELGKQDAREGEHKNPFPHGSVLSREWRRGHCEVACDECNARRTQFRCPQCSSASIKTWDYNFRWDSETGYVDAGVRAECLDCRFSSDAEEFTVSCEHCGGTGVEPPRNYLGEAFKIVAGESTLIPERAHLVAVVDHCRKLASAALALPETEKREVA